MKLSESEKYILTIIINKGQATSFDILDIVKESKKLSENTIRTLLTRMVKKKAIYISEKNGKTYTYKSLIDKEDFIKQSIEEFLEIHQLTKKELRERL